MELFKNIVITLILILLTHRIMWPVFMNDKPFTILWKYLLWLISVCAITWITDSISFVGKSFMVFGVLFSFFWLYIYITREKK